MDNSVIDDFTAERQRFDRMMLGVHTSIPGIICKVYCLVPNKAVFVDVQPAIKMKIAKPGEAITFLDLPVIERVPICLAHSEQAGLFITIPIKVGGVGEIRFQERSIDNFIKSGDVSFPAEGNKQVSPRHHDLTDAVFVPGVYTKASALTNWNQDAIELRNTDRSVFMSIYADRIEGKGTLNWTGDMNITGTVAATVDVKAATISGRYHVHVDPQGGSVAQPTP